MSNKLNEILAKIDQLSDAMKVESPMLDLNGVLPKGGHHQCAVFLRLPWPGVLNQYSNVQERVVKFLGSLNRESTMKADVYTVCGANVAPGFQPQMHALEGKNFDIDSVIAGVGDYVLRITVDITFPPVLEELAKAVNETEMENE